MKNTIISAGVAVLVVVLGFTFFAPRPQEQPVGSASSVSVVGNCTETNGVTQCYSKQSFGAATTTVCNIKSPSATSTLRIGSARFLLATTSAVLVTLARATTPNATTTFLGSAALAAGAQGMVMASSTQLTDLDPANLTFPPNTYFNVGVQGGTGTGALTYSPTGYGCTTVFQVI